MLFFYTRDVSNQRIYCTEAPSKEFCLRRMQDMEFQQRRTISSPRYYLVPFSCVQKLCPSVKQWYSGWNYPIERKIIR